MSQQLGFDFPPPEDSPSGRHRSSTRNSGSPTPTKKSNASKDHARTRPAQSVTGPDATTGITSSQPSSGLNSMFAEILADENAMKLITEVMRDRSLGELTVFAVEIPEVVRLTGISRSTLYERMEDGSLSYSQVASRKRVIPVWALLDFLGRSWFPPEAA